MLNQAKTLVAEKELRFQENLDEARTRLDALQSEVRLQYRKAHLNGTKVVFNLAATTEPKLSSLLDDQRLPQTPLHTPLRQRIERFNTPIIPNYDALNTKKIVRQLRGLSTWNLLKVNRREQITKNRKTIFQAVEREHRRNLNR